MICITLIWSSYSCEAIYVQNWSRHKFVFVDLKNQIIFLEWYQKVHPIFVRCLWYPKAKSHPCDQLPVQHQLWSHHCVITFLTNSTQNQLLLSRIAWEVCLLASSFISTWYFCHILGCSFKINWFLPLIYIRPLFKTKLNLLSIFISSVNYY